MSITSLLRVTTSDTAPFDGSTPAVAAGPAVVGSAAAAAPAAVPGTVSVSGFLTVQSLTNFAAMTGAITAAWHALARLHADWFTGLWVPYALAGAFAVVSLLISSDGFRKKAAGTERWDFGQIVAAVFIAIINALVLASAVRGASIVTTGPAT